MDHGCGPPQLPLWTHDVVRWTEMPVLHVCGRCRLVTKRCDARAMVPCWSGKPKCMGKTMPGNE